MAVAVFMKTRCTSSSCVSFSFVFLCFYFYFLKGLDSKGSRDPWEAGWSQFSEPWGPTAVRTDLCFFPIKQFLKLKKLQNWEVHGFSSRIIQSGPGFKTLISDNGLQFDSKAFWRYCCDLGITNRYSTSAYPQRNGQAEAVNKVIMNGLKKRLVDAMGKWVEELSHVLWTYRITSHQSTRETPFSMTYGVEAVIPLKTGFPMLRTSSFTLSHNDKLLGKSLDLIEEQKENAMIQLAYYQHKLK